MSEASRLTNDLIEPEKPLRSWQIIKVLLRGPRSGTQITKETGMLHQTSSGRIADLTAMGLITSLPGDKVPSPNGAVEGIYRLTEKGERLRGLDAERQNDVLSLMHRTLTECNKARAAANRDFKASWDRLTLMETGATLDRHLPK